MRPLFLHFLTKYDIIELHKNPHIWRKKSLFCAILHIYICTELDIIKIRTVMFLMCKHLKFKTNGSLTKKISMSVLICPCGICGLQKHESVDNWESYKILISKLYVPIWYMRLWTSIKLAIKKMFMKREQAQYLLLFFYAGEKYATV